MMPFPGHTPADRAALEATVDRLLAAAGAQVLDDDDPRWHAYRAEQERAAQIQAVIDWTHRGIPARTRATLAETLYATPATTAVADFLAAPAAQAAFLALGGTYGCGKTVAACWGLTQRDGRFLDASDLTHWGSGWSALERIEAVAKVPLLVLDDCGLEVLENKAAQSNFLGLLLKRYAALRRTIFTGNFTRDAFEARYLDKEFRRLRSRWREAGRFLDCGTQDLRSYSR